MAQLQFGLTELARTNGETLRELMQQPRWRDEAECRGFLAELAAVAAAKKLREFKLVD